MEKVRVGIIGFGNIGRRPYENDRKRRNQGFELACICDNDAAKRTLAAQMYPASGFASHGKLLASGLADAAVIATSHCFHASIAAEAMHAGLYVLSEKPADEGRPAVSRAVTAARETGKADAIMFNQRANPLFRAQRT